MEFRHKNIRLPVDRYVGSEWYFVTFCCENRETVFQQQTRAEWFLNHLRGASAAHGIAVHAFCLMPDHIHLLAQGLSRSSHFLKFVKVLKQKTGYEYKQETGKQLWQKKSYDRILRSRDSPDSVAWYIWMNPVRKGLCRKAGEYAFSGSLTGAGVSTEPTVRPWIPPGKGEQRPT
jgi:putative transposase